MGLFLFISLGLGFAIGITIGNLCSYSFNILSIYIAIPPLDQAAIPYDFWQSLLFSATIEGRPTLGIFIWSTYLTSIWIWLFGLASLIIGFLRNVKLIESNLFGLNIHERPYQAHGVIMIILVTLIFAIYPLVKYFLQSAV